jgi:hypothetical protein
MAAPNMTLVQTQKTALHSSTDKRDRELRCAAHTVSRIDAVALNRAVEPHNNHA